MHKPFDEAGPAVTVDTPLSFNLFLLRHAQKAPQRHPMLRRESSTLSAQPRGRAAENWLPQIRLKFCLDLMVVAGAGSSSAAFINDI
jgi:hypothetical protein